MLMVWRWTAQPSASLGEAATTALLGPELKVFMSQLSKLMKDAAAGKPGSQARAELSIEEKAVLSVVDVAKKYMPDKMQFHKGSMESIKTESEEATQALHKSMLCTCFAIVKGHATFATEKNFYPALRVSFNGTREVVLVPCLTRPWQSWCKAWPPETAQQQAWTSTTSRQMGPMPTLGRWAGLICSHPAWMDV